MGDLEVDTRLARVAGGEGRYCARISRDWQVWGPNGGYLAALALRAAGAEAQIPRPVACAVHYLSTPRFAEAELRVVALRRGRRSESLRVTLAQDGRPVLEALVRTAATLPGLAHTAAQPPDLPGPEPLPNAEEIFGDAAPPLPFWANVEQRPPDGGAAWRSNRLSGDPSHRTWYRFRPRATFDDPFVDAARALVILDILPWCAAWECYGESDLVAPNLDVVAWFHHPTSAHPWLLGDARAPVSTEGLIGGHARVWGVDGRLLASGGAQLLCMQKVAIG